MSKEITIVDGVVHIPYQSIVDFAYNMLECCDDLKTWGEMEQWHQDEVNRLYGRYTEKEYEEVPKEEIDKYEAYRQMLIDEENEPWE